jgi:hypothetical protein
MAVILGYLHRWLRKLWEAQQREHLMRLAAEDTVSENLKGQRLIVDMLDQIVTDKKKLLLSKEAEDRILTVWNKAVHQLTMHKSYDELYREREAVRGE